MRLALKTTILARFGTQREFARASSIPENRLSALVRGWTQPTDDERARVARMLGAPAERLFPEGRQVEVRSVG
jgi:plasmid maintenance system antidote protein VapI